MRMKTLFAVVFALFPAFAFAEPDERFGCTVAAPCVVRVIDGDTIAIGNRKWRLCGIDAPELGTVEGIRAAQWLHNTIYQRVFGGGKQALTCNPVGMGTPCDGRSPRMSYDREVGQCFVGQDDLAELLVEHGHARDFPRYSGGHYRTEL